MKILRGRLEELRTVSIRPEKRAPTNAAATTVLHRGHPQEPQPLRLFVVQLQEAGGIGNNINIALSAAAYPFLWTTTHLCCTKCS